MSVWPSKRRTRRWDDIEWIHTRFLPDHRTVRTTFRFRSGRKLTLGATQDFTWTKARGRFAELVALAVAAAPKEAHINEDTLELALHGSRAARREALQPAAMRPDADALVRRARHHRVWMELPKALSLVKEALHQQPTHAEALRLRCKFYWDLGRPKEARRAAQEWLAVRPDDPEAKRHLLQIELALDSPGVVEDAHAVLARTPGDAALGDALSGYHFRRGEHEAAAAVWERLEPHAPDPEARKFAAERARYIRRYGIDAGFRRIEKMKATRRTALIVAAALLPLMFVVGMQVWRWQEQRERDRRFEEFRKDLDERREKMERELTEITGRIFGTPEEIRARAGKGEAAAEFTFGEMLIEGDKVAKDVPAGVALLERAAARNHRQAIFALAAHYRDGAIVEKDLPRVATLLHRASELGSTRASLDLAEMYSKGEGVGADKSAAFVLFERAAEGGSAYGMRRAGAFLERGEGVEMNVSRALDYYRTAAEKGDMWSIDRLVHRLMPRDEEHSDPEEGWRWITKGAELGSARWRVAFASAILLGARHDETHGASALPWLVEAADKGSSAAQGFLGSCYLNGLGVQQDFAKAAGWFAKSEPTQEKSRALLGLCHAFGLGVERDLGKARVLRSQINDPAEQKWLDRYLEGAETAAAPSRTIVPLFQAQPQYPTRLWREGIEGRVLLAFTVDREGFVSDVRVVESTRTEFEAPARLAISCWKFSPLDGRDSINVQQAISFNLKDQRGEEADAPAQP